MIGLSCLGLVVTASKRISDPDLGDLLYGQSTLDITSRNNLCTVWKQHELSNM